MLVTCGFKMGPVPPGKFYNHPPLGVGDIEQLKELFPDNPIWKARTNDIGNVYHPTREQALAFYQALVEYAELEPPSDEKYIAGGYTAPFLIESDLKSVFEDLMVFFERELGLSDRSATRKELDRLRCPRCRKLLIATEEKLGSLRIYRCSGKCRREHDERPVGFVNYNEADPKIDPRWIEVGV